MDDNAQKATGAAEDFLNLDSLIKRYLSDIDTLKKQIREKRDIFQGGFENDADYHEAEEKVREVSTKKKEAKERIMKLPATVAVQDELKDLRDRLKHAQGMLSGYLQKFVRETGATTIEDLNGNVLQIVPNFKLVKKQE